MRFTILTLSLVSLVGCGELNARRFSGPTGPAGATGAAGQDGTDGEDGTDGVNGENGHSAVVSTLDIAPGCADGGVTLLLAVDTNDNGQVDSGDSYLQSKEICNGAHGINGQDGLDGAAGRDGIDGQDGRDGIDGRNGVDGQDGADGQDAPPTAYTPVQIIDPCGDAPGKIDEVFLRLANGTLLASFSDNASGSNTRFSVLGQGSYQTTDGTGCKFSVDQNGVVYNERY